MIKALRKGKLRRLRLPEIEGRLDLRGLTWAPARSSPLAFAGGTYVELNGLIELRDRTFDGLDFSGAFSSIATSAQLPLP